MMENKRQNHLKNKGHLTLVDLFKYYPYKDVDMTKVQGRNYIPKEEIIPNHKFSLTLAQWKEIVTTIFEVTLDKVIQGKTINLPYHFGEVYAKKYKKRKLKWFEDFNFTGDYQVFIAWKKTNRTPLGWAMRLFWSNYAKKKMIKSVTSDYTLVNHYRTE